MSNILANFAQRTSSSCSYLVFGKTRSVLHIREVPGLPEKSVLMPIHWALNYDWISFNRSRGLMLFVGRGKAVLADAGPPPAALRLFEIAEFW